MNRLLLIGVILAGCGLMAWQAAEASVVNLALDGTATQSSTRVGSGGNVASVAIDGNTDGVFNNGSVTHTLGNEPGSWNVDLNSTFRISSIQVYNRTDSCCRTRLDGARLRVLDAAGTTVTSVDLETWGGPSPPNSKSFVLPGSTAGQNVRVDWDNTSNHTLSLAEVQVFGSDVPNVATNPNAVASQSSTRVGSGGNVASVAIDGNTNGEWSGNSVTHTLNSPTPSWWQVELNPLPSELYEVDEIILYNRTDSNGNRLSNFRVSVFNGAVETFGQDFFTTSGYAGAKLPIALPDTILGDRVRVEMLGPNRQNNWTLSLAEVQVFAALVPEPTTLLIWSLLAGLGIGLGWRRRK